MDIESKVQTILYAAEVVEMGSGKYEVCLPPTCCEPQPFTCASHLLCRGTNQSALRNAWTILVTHTVRCACCPPAPSRCTSLARLVPVSQVAVALVGLRRRTNGCHGGKRVTTPWRAAMDATEGSK